MDKILPFIGLATVFVIWAVVVYKRVYKKHDRPRDDIHLTIKFNGEEVIITDRGRKQTVRRSDRTDFDHVHRYLTNEYNLWLSDFRGHDERKSFTFMRRDWSARLILCDNYVLCLKVEFEIDCK